MTKLCKKHNKVMDINEHERLSNNATFNNISVILWWSVLLMEETRENQAPAASH
jgi:hypothetical protein